MKDSSRKSDQAQVKDSSSGWSVAPMAVLREAIRHVPALKFALGITAICASLAVIKSFNLDFRIAVFGVVVMLILMTVLSVFARQLSMPARDVFPLAKFFAWFCVSLVVATAIALFTSVFWNWPVPLSEKLFSASKSVQTNVEPKQTDQVAKEPAREGERASPTHSGIHAGGSSLKGQGSQIAGRAVIKRVEQSQESASGCKSNVLDQRSGTAYVGAFALQVIDKNTKTPLSGIHVLCGDSGMEDRLTGTDGSFSCTVPAHTTLLLVEINTPGYKHFHENIPLDCEQPISLESTRP
jgi:hypothetical protein